MRCTTKSNDYYRDTRTREFMQRFINSDVSTLSNPIGTYSSNNFEASSTVSRTSATTSEAFKKTTINNNGVPLQNNISSTKDTKS